MFAHASRLSAPALALVIAPCVAGVAARSPSTPAPVRDVERAPLVGKSPPELRAGARDWLAGPPVTLAALKGKVVWLQFNF